MMIINLEEKLTDNKNSPPVVSETIRTTYVQIENKKSLDADQGHNTPSDILSHFSWFSDHQQGVGKTFEQQSINIDKVHYISY